MCDKKSIRELREDAALKSIWHKTCDVVDHVADPLAPTPLWPEELKKKEKPRETKEMEFIERYMR